VHVHDVTFNGIESQGSSFAASWQSKHISSHHDQVLAWAREDELGFCEEALTRCAFGSVTMFKLLAACIHSMACHL
jgi:hypothetical protein